LASQRASFVRPEGEGDDVEVVDGAVACLDGEPVRQTLMPFGSLSTGSWGEAPDEDELVHGVSLSLLAAPGGRAGGTGSPGVEGSGSTAGVSEQMPAKDPASEATP
jgi:hypothetical protein